MAVGDFVQDVFTQLGTSSFQPAGTNVIMITSFWTFDGTPIMSDGVLTSVINNAYVTASSGAAVSNVKVFINNGHFLQIPASVLLGKCYSGVQVA